MMNIDTIREEFPLTKRYIYMDNAACSPLPNRSIDSTVGTVKEKAYGDLFWEKWDNVVETVRKEVSKLINAGTESIALTPNTSEGISIVANGLRYNNSNIVTTDMEFPSNLYPWDYVSKKNAVELRVVRNIDGKIPLEGFDEAIDENTKVVAVSHIQYSNGFRTDLKALTKIAHDKGALVLTDAVQSLGHMPVDVKDLDIDFLSTSGYKWLLSPIGTGFLYVKRELIDELHMSIIGYRSCREMYNFSFRSFEPSPEARRFEHGQPNFPGFSGMKSSIDLIRKYGTEKIWMRIKRLTEILRQEMEGNENYKLNSPESMDELTGITNFGCKNPELINKRLRRQNIIISVRSGGLRISPHFYNLESEIIKLTEIMKKVIRA